MKTFRILFFPQLSPLGTDHLILMGVGDGKILQKKKNNNNNNNNQDRV